jgi:hypothetical protein
MSKHEGTRPNPNNDRDAHNASNASGPRRGDTPDPGRPADVPPGELFADGETRMAWAAINTLSEGQLHELLGVMQSKAMLPELRPGKQAQRIATVVAALTEAAKQLMVEQRLHSIADVKLTEQEYERLRRLNDGEQWPPPSTIRRWIGAGWNDALRDAKLQPVFDGDALVVELGPKFTRGDVLAALSEYAEEGVEEIPTVRGFLAWSRRPEVMARPGRRPRSLGPLNRLFPLGWPQVLAAAGLIAPEDAPDSDVGMRGESWGAARPAWGTGYTVEHVRQALRECAGVLGRSPKMGEYQAWREDRFVEQREQGLLPKAIPSSSLIQNRFATWDDALVDAALEPARGRSRPTRSGDYPPRPKRIRDEEIFAAVCEAFEKVGRPFTVSTYSAWRKEKVVELRRRRKLDKVPSYHVMHERFGSFEETVRRAREWQKIQQTATDATADDERNDDDGLAGAAVPSDR